MRFAFRRNCRPQRWALSARVGEWPRLVGRAKLAEALALDALDRTTEARECNDEAVEIARAAGSPLLRLRSLGLHVRLTGSERSRRNQRELHAALSA
ncbi:MAG: hypothetical protein ABI346_07620 [Candidatus Baltobacteraceae bacterium]